CFTLSIIADGGLTGGVFGIYAFAKIKDPIFRKIGGVLVLNSVQILILAFNFSYDGLADLAATCLLFLLVTSFYNGQKGANIGKVFYWFYPLHLLALSLFRIAFLLFL
ncbi:TraX family protein, partial [Streptococcus gordonii]